MPKFSHNFCWPANIRTQHLIVYTFSEEQGVWELIWYNTAYVVIIVRTPLAYVYIFPSRRYEIHEYSSCYGRSNYHGSVPHNNNRMPAQIILAGYRNLLCALSCECQVWNSIYKDPYLDTKLAWWTLLQSCDDNAYGFMWPCPLAIRWITTPKMLEDCKEHAYTIWVSLYVAKIVILI